MSGKKSDQKPKQIIQQQEKPQPEKPQQEKTKSPVELDKSSLKEDAPLGSDQLKESKLDAQRKQNSEQLDFYLSTTGISMAFKVIFAEIIGKEMKQAEALPYAHERLLEIGRELGNVQVNAKLRAQKSPHKTNENPNNISSSLSKSIDSIVPPVIAQQASKATIKPQPKK